TNNESILLNDGVWTGTNPTRLASPVLVAAEVMRPNLSTAATVSRPQATVPIAEGTRSPLGTDAEKSEVRAAFAPALGRAHAEGASWALVDHLFAKPENASLWGRPVNEP